MVPTQEQLLDFLRKHNLPNLSKIAKHFNIQNSTVSDLVKDLEEKKLVNIVNVGGSKVVQVKEDKMKKRGQVSVFIILGIVIVVVLGSVVYLNNSSIKDKLIKQNINEEFVPVKNYFDSCIKDVTLQGANVLGSQGGYITIPQDNLPVNPIEPFSNRLQVFGNDAVEVPYWDYETNNGIQKTQIPNKQDMEKDLQNYISNNLNNCLTNFTSFQDYEINGFNNFQTTVKIEDEKIFVDILSKLSVKHKNVLQEFDKFSLIIDSPLGKLYNKAVEILNKETTENFFEEKTIDMLVLYDQIPYTGVNLNCNPRIWNVENIKQDLKKVLKINIEAIRPNSPRKYFSYNLNTDANINFKYEENWPLFLEVNGGEKVLKEQSSYGENNPAASFLKGLFCLNNYHFIYDIKYPILVILNDKNFDFQFSKMIIIKNNQPRENKLGIKAPLEVNQKICESGTTETSISLVDQDTNEKISDAEIKFSCVGTICNLGKTSENGLTTKIPSCLNAVISAEKQGYNKAKTTIDTNEKSNLFLYLKPQYEKNINIKVIDGNQIRNALASEFVTFTLTNLDDDTQISFNQDDTKVKVSEGEYEVNSYIIRDYPNGIKLAKQELEYCTEVPKPSLLGLIGFKENQCTKTEIPETTIDKVLVGGAKFKFTLTKEQLKNSNSIIFYTLFNKVPGNTQELAEMYSLIQKNPDSTNFKLPIVK